MMFLRRFTWWLRRRRKESELQEELRFHLEQEADDRRAAGLRSEDANRAARRDLGNEVLLREEVRALWTWRPLDELAQDLRYAWRILIRNRSVTIFAGLSLALGIGANTAIYSFVDSILLRPLPVPDPASLVVMKWQSKPFAYGSSARNGSEFVLRGISGRFYRNPDSVEGFIFPFPAFERLEQPSAPVLSSLFAFFAAGKKNVIVNGQAELGSAQYVTGDFFRGLGVLPSAGRLLSKDDDRPGAPPAVVISALHAERRFGAIANAVGQPVLIDNVAFTVVGVTSSGFFGVDPGAAPDLYLPMRANLLFDPESSSSFQNANYYWIGIMGRLRPGVTIAEAEKALGQPFSGWVAPTAGNDRERANLPVLKVVDGAGGVDRMRRMYAQPLYLLLAVVGLILAIACANTANLLLGRAAARRREIAVRLGIGAGRARLIRQLLTESVALAAASGALGVLIAFAGIRVLTALLVNGDPNLTLHAELNGRVLLITLALSLLCGTVFGLAPALQSTRADLVGSLKETSIGGQRFRLHRWIPRLNLTDILVVAQVTILILLLVTAGLFLRTLSNIQQTPLGFNPDNVLLFQVNALQAGRPAADLASFYDDLHRRLAEHPGVRQATVSHASLIKAGWGTPIYVGETYAQGIRLLQTGPNFFKTMEVRLLDGREIDGRDRQGSARVVVVSDLFATTFFPGQRAIGRHITMRARNQVPVDFEVVGVAAPVQYGPLKYDVPPIVYFPYLQLFPAQLGEMTYALRTDGDPLRLVPDIRALVHQADARLPVTAIRTQSADVDQTINQEIVLARLCGAFAGIALVIACAGLYGVLSYAVTRRTREIGIRMALGAKRRAVIWLVLRRVCLLAALGLAISIPIARSASALIESFLFRMQPNDPGAVALAVTMLLMAAVIAGFGPARKASRIDPTTALRQN